MAKENFLVDLAKSLLSVVWHFIYWPLWWYSSGFLLVLKFTGQRIALAWKGLALDVWLLNIFVPMYGQFDAASRAISFIIRVIQIVLRFAIMVVISLLILLIPLIYLGLPVLAVWQLSRIM